jgi:thioredoxin 1
MMAPIIEQLDQEIHNVAFAKVDVDQNQALAQQYQIHSIPTVILFKDGKVVAKFMGFLPKIEIVKFINKYVQ